jgi:hypothetical protein
MNWNWKEEGFKYSPSQLVTSADLIVYRAWGGHPGRKMGNINRAGVCFSLDKVSTRWEAEQLYSVLEYGNSVFYLTEFKLKKGTPVWLGNVDPGDPRALLGKEYGSQVFIERIHLYKIVEGKTIKLKDDLSPFTVLSGNNVTH